MYGDTEKNAQMQIDTAMLHGPLRVRGLIHDTDVNVLRKERLHRVDHLRHRGVPKPILRTQRTIAAHTSELVREISRRVDRISE